MSMPSHFFSVQIPAQLVLRYYQGKPTNVQVYDQDNRRIEFSLQHLVQFATKSGISGSFVLHADNEDRFLGVERVE
jgi:regulatory protein YycI of two-component signal transduction system YycFG